MKFAWGVLQFARKQNYSRLLEKFSSTGFLLLSIYCIFIVYYEWFIINIQKTLRSCCIFWANFRCQVTHLQFSECFFSFDEIPCDFSVKNVQIVYAICCNERHISVFSINSHSQFHDFRYKPQLIHSVRS